MEKRLTQKQEIFCIKYVELGNAGDAAVVAGYAPKYAATNTDKLLKNTKIQARIDELNTEVKSAAVMNKQERMERLSEIARARLTDFMELGQDGSWVNLGPEVPMTGAIQEIRSRTEYDKDGARPTVYTSVKLHNPLQAIDLLNKMDKLYSEGSLVQNNISRTINVIVADNKTKDLIERAGERTKLLANPIQNNQSISGGSGSVESGQEKD